MFVARQLGQQRQVQRLQLLIQSFASGPVQLGIEPQHVFLAGGDELLIEVDGS